MKKALNAWTVTGTTGFEEMFRLVKEAGFDGIELNVEDAGSSAHSLSFETTDAELEEIAGFSKKYDLPVVSISSALYWLYGPGAADEERRELSKKVMRTQIKFAKALGAPGILIVPGGIHEHKSIAKAYETSMQTMFEMNDEIKAGKIFVGVENVWNGFFMSPYDMMVFTDKLENPYVGSYFDVGNVIAYSWPENWIEILGERIKLVHVKDFKRTASINTGGEFVDLLEGDADWSLVVPALRKAGFDGYLTAEVAGPGSEDDELEHYKKIACALDKILSN